MNLPRRFKIKLNPDSYGSEHRNALIRQADGHTVTILSELRNELFLTDFRLEGDPPDSDYAHGGFLLVMLRDGTWARK